MTLPAGTRLGPAELGVADLDRSVGYYRDVLGFEVRTLEPGRAALGADRDVVVLHEQPGVRRAGRHAGLFHVAYLFPTREELARALVRLAGAGARLTGASDHGVSEALYLRDPDGHGVELYADRPPEAWPAPSEPDERVGMFTAPLDLEALLATVEGEEPRATAAPGLVVGHVHLQIGDLDRAWAFYGDVLGFELMTRYPGALFVAAGGYHHHVGLNTWAGAGLGPQPADVAGLRSWTVHVGDEREVEAVAGRAEAAGAAVSREDGAVVVRDPWDLAVRVAA